MIISTIKGDAVKLFLEGKFNFAHGCNCYNTMGAGIAKQVKKYIPMLYQEDQKTEKGAKYKLGTMNCIEHNGLYAFNLYTQFEHWNGRDVDYHAIKTAIIQAVKHLIIKGITTPLCIPKIGAGLAGGDWNKIYDIINTNTGTFPIVVVEFDK